MKSQTMWAIPYYGRSIEDGVWLIFCNKPKSSMDGSLFARGVIDEDTIKSAVRVRVTIEPTNPRKEKR